MRPLIAVGIVLVTLGMAGTPSVQDGDTIKFNVRLFGIDAPELRQQCSINDICYPCGQEAAKAMRELVKGQHVQCKPTGQISYGRSVSVCYVGQVDVAEQMLFLGHAITNLDYLSQRPDLLNRYAEAETNARLGLRGMWQGDFVSPGYWRKGERLECER